MFSSIATIFFVLLSSFGLSASAQDSLAGVLGQTLPEPEIVVAKRNGAHDARLADEIVTSLAPLPGKSSSATEDVFIDARSAVAMDSATKEVLFEQNMNQELAMASITKVMTALLVIEEGKLNDTVTITSEDVIKTGSDIDLRSAEEIKLGDLLKAALIKSANDAATAMARHVGGDDLDNFVAMMNAKAEELGLTNTQYMNPHGFDEEGHYSTAHDIALLMAHAMENETFRKISAMKEHDAKILNFDERDIHITATNKLLIQDDSLIEGGKTGFTDEAGECLVTVAKNPEQHRVVTVILNSPDRFNESQKLINYVFDKYQW
ncbi:D-alanyl-D-alanine carboxypeptidase family protein [Patescibacteria group bacterium]